MKTAEEVKEYYTKHPINVTSAFHNMVEDQKKEAAHVEANREEADRTRTPAYESPRVYVDNPTQDQYTNTVTVELAHREALAENIERDTLSNIEATQRMDAEADEREAINAGE